ncbi:centromere-associated protein E [Carex littledalei]|uniref:Centromere-associated protein E n=1 Tax=Carex littledalei TaxID=544730 RepID=A0A833R6G7_9POAL|nr:centromere-associated protein E [Carex littledalei]
MERIYVAVRARPLPPEELKSVPWQINANSISLSNQSHKFEFDRIFSENCKTKDVYEARTKDIVASAVSGFNGTVFAYGQTSSGKTHTMKGSDAEPGIIPLAIQDLFHTIQETGDREFLLRMSYMEIYNEEINDLLAPEHRKLQIHENIERGIYVAGLKEEIVNCPEQVLDLMKFGESHRHIGETNMNLYSSRSHTIFRMIIESREKLEDIELNDSCDAVRVSVLNLVDLAGSERVAKTGAEGKRLKEGSHINKSLLTLGSVIQKLSEGAQNQGGHVPYRDSKLTRILQPALGGNANTAIICNITLAHIHADETKSSLQFASKAKRVTNCAQVNEIVTDAALLKRQKKMIEELQAKLNVSHNEEWEEQILTLRNTLLQSELEKERISLELEEEKKAKAQREERLLEQARKIENLSSLVFLSDRDEKTAPSLKSQKKRRVTWCPARSATQDEAEDTSKSHRASSGAALVPFEILMEEDESFLDELENRNIGEIPFPEALSLLNVTSRRKINSKENNEEIEYCSSGEKSNEQVGSPGRSTVQSLTLRESEAILIIKQLEDQIKLLELEKASTQNDLDNVLKLATQQNNSFTKKYEEMQQDVVKAREEARIAQEKVSMAKSFEENSLENVGPVHAEVLEGVEGLELLVGQSKHSTDGLVSFVEELFQNFSTLSNMLQEVKSSADGEILEFKTVLSESEMLTIQLSGKAKELNIEKSILEGQLIDCQSEIENLKCDINICEKTMAEVKEQHEFEKEELCTQLVMMQNEIAVLSSSSLIREIESLSESEMLTIQLSGKAKDLNIEKNLLEGQLIDCQSENEKLKCDINNREKTMASLLEGQLNDCQSEIENLKCDINIREKTMASLLKGQLIDCQSEIEKLKCDINSCEKTMDEMKEQHELEKEELCTQLVMMENEIAILSSSSLIREIESLRKELDRTKTKFKDAEAKLKTSIHEKIKLEGEKAQAAKEIKELTNKRAHLERDIRKQESKHESKLTAQKLKEAESSIQSLESCCESSQKEKEELEMQLTDALLEAEAQKSMCLSKEKTIIQATEQAKISDKEILRLSKDLSEAELKLEACREEYKLLKKSSDEKLSLKINEAEVLRRNSDHTVSQLKKEKDNLMAKITALEAKIYDDLEPQLVTVTKERDSLMGTMEKLCLKLNEAEKLRRNSDHMISQLKTEKDNLMANITALESKIRDDFQCQLVAITKEKDALRCTNEKMRVEINEGEILRQSSDRMVLNAKMERDELAARISSMEAKMQDMEQDELRYKTELTECQIRYRSTQEKLDEYKRKCVALDKKHKLMHQKFTEASDELKNKLRTYGLEILKLKKELANSKSSSSSSSGCASASAQ